MDTLNGNAGSKVTRKSLIHSYELKSHKSLRFPDDIGTENLLKHQVVCVYPIEQ